MNYLLLGCLFLLLVVIFLLIKLSKQYSAQQISNINFTEEFTNNRLESSKNAHLLRKEVNDSQNENNKSAINAIAKIGESQKQSLDSVAHQIKSLLVSNDQGLSGLRKEVGDQIRSLQKSNEQKLEQMRLTVDEKLQNTLEKRLGESFKLVSERLESVQRGLGDMQNLATGVGDLKRVLTNVKARGTWAEYQLEDILMQTLTIEQVSKNVMPNPDSRAVVEFAIRLPDAYLPIDSKFPKEDYERLSDAAEIGDKEAVEKATKSLITTIKRSAKEISDKYINPPHTTNFAVLFLPTEGLYAEILRQPNLVEQLQNDYRIQVAGPTTLTALLNSLRLGFRTLAIEQKSSEVWQILSAVKTEFGKFGGVLDKVKKQLQTAANTIDETKVRTRAMDRELNKVEQMELHSATHILGLESVEKEV